MIQIFQSDDNNLNNQMKKFQNQLNQHDLQLTYILKRKIDLWIAMSKRTHPYIKMPIFE